MAKLAKNDAKAPTKAAKGNAVPAKAAKPVVPVKISKPAPAKQAPVVVKTAAKASKPAPKAPAAKAPPVKAPAKPVAKPVVKTATKSTPISAAKPVAKAAPVKIVPAKVAPKAAAKPSKVQPKTAPAPVVKPTAKAAAPKAPVAKAAPVVAAKPTKAAKPAPKGKAVAPVIEVAPAKPAKGKAKAAPVEIAPVVEAPKKGKKEKAAEAAEADMFQGGFFFEVPVGSAAVRKVKTTIVQSAPVSKKAAKDEETHDELLARIERDLHKARMTVRKVTRTMVCTKCCIMPVDEAFIVDRDTAFCTECALMLGLGHTREARHQNFHPSLQKGSEEEDDA